MMIPGSFISYLTTSAARSAAAEITSVWGVPFCSDALDRSAPLGLKALRNAGRFSNDRFSAKDEVSRKTESMVR